MGVECFGALPATVGVVNTHWDPENLKGIHNSTGSHIKTNKMLSSGKTREWDHYHYDQTYCVYISCLSALIQSLNCRVNIYPQQCQVTASTKRTVPTKRKYPKLTPRYTVPKWNRDPKISIIKPTFDSLTANCNIIQTIFYVWLEYLKLWRELSTKPDRHRNP